MSTRDDFDSSHPLPLFLADEPEQQYIGTFWDRVLSRVLKASIVVATATAIGIAILSVGNPVALFAYLTASLVDKSAQPGTDLSTPAIQSTVDAQALPIARDAPIPNEIAAAPEPASQSQKEISEPSSEALFKQFEAWAADKDAPAQVGPVKSVEDAPAQAAENARARPMQKHRHVRPVYSARAEIPPVHRKKVRPEQNARLPVAPAQDSTQDHTVQNAQAPSFLPTFGWRN
jgi:hypothetical protein